MTTTYDFTGDNAIQQGSTFTKTFIWKDSDIVPIDLTGYAAKMQIRKSIDSSTVLLELSTVNGRITIGGATGQVVLTVSAEETALLAFTYGIYDLEVISAGGVVTRLLSGQVLVSQEVTR